MAKRQWAINLLCAGLMVSLSGCCWFRGCRNSDPVVDLGSPKEDLGNAYGQGPGPAGDGALAGGPIDPNAGTGPSWGSVPVGETGRNRPPGGPVKGELQMVFFDYDKSDIRGDQNAALEENLRAMRDNPDYLVTIEGHADERGTAAYNIALGDRRADSCQEYLIRNGIQPSRISTVSYGKERPLVIGDSEDGYAKNRRCEFKVRSANSLASAAR